MNDRAGAICIHAYYLEVFEEILGRIAKLGVTEEIFVSCPADHETSARRLLEAAGLDARILVTANLGMDILPFLRVVREFDLTARARVLKLHTKNPSRRGRMHMRLMLNAALGDRRLVEEVRTSFAANPRLVQIGAELLYRPTDLSAHGNRSLMAEILQDILSRPAAFGSGFFVGSTFWRAGAALRPLVAELDRFEAMARAEPAARAATGGDGAVAHALGRLWLEALGDKGADIGLVRAQTDGAGYTLREIDAREGALEDVRVYAAGVLIEREAAYRRDHADISASGLFHAGWYQARYGAAIPTGMSPLEHFMLHGEVTGASPSARFPTGYHRITSELGDAKNTFASFVRAHPGKAPSAPTTRDWIALAEKIGAFDPDWYLAAYGDAARLGAGAVEHLIAFGLGWGRPASPGFDPAKARALGGASARKTPPLIDYLKSHMERERELHALIGRQIESGDMDLAMRLIDRVVDGYGPTGALLTARALAHAHFGDWIAAEGDLDGARAALPGWRLSRSLIRPGRPSEGAFAPIEGRWAKLSPDSFSIYSTAFGGEAPPPPFSGFDGVERLLFTDRAGAAPGWRPVIITSPDPDPALASAYCRLMAHRLIEGRRFSLYIDPAADGEVTERFGATPPNAAFAATTHSRLIEPWGDALTDIVEGARAADAPIGADQTLREPWAAGLSGRNRWRDDLARP